MTEAAEEICERIWRRRATPSRVCRASNRSFRAQTAYITAFLEHHLRGKEEKLLMGPSPKYPEVRIA